MNLLVVQNLTGTSKTQRSGRQFVNKRSLRQATHYLIEYMVNILLSQSEDGIHDRTLVDFFLSDFVLFLAALCVHTHETRILPDNKDNHIKGE